MQVCTPITVDCSVCYPLAVNFSTGVITLPVNLVGSMYVWVRDKFQNLFNQSTYSYGSVLINVNQFPIGMFWYGERYDVFFTSDAAGTTVIPFNISMTSYNCLFLTINGC